MGNWPVNPPWTDPATINTGNEFESADGLTNEDINKIVKDLIYMYRHGRGTTVVANPTVLGDELRLKSILIGDTPYIINDTTVANTNPPSTGTYVSGDLWINALTQNVYICVANTSNTLTWKIIGLPTNATPGQFLVAGASGNPEWQTIPDYDGSVS